MHEIIVIIYKYEGIYEFIVIMCYYYYEFSNMKIYMKDEIIYEIIIVYEFINMKLMVL